MQHFYLANLMNLLYLCAGGILAGVISDRLNARAITCVTMLLLAVPSVSVGREGEREALY